MPWPSSAVNSGPRRLSQAHGITETCRNSQPTCSAASCSSPADRPDVQSQAKAFSEPSFPTAHQQPCRPPIVSIRSDGRANGPRRKLGRTGIVLLALGPLARGHLEDALEDTLSGPLHRLMAIHDGAAVDVHVLLHALEKGRVGRDLDGRRRLPAEHAPAACGEADEVCTPSNLSS